MASNITNPKWRVKITGIPVSVTLAQLTQGLGLQPQYRVVIPKVQTYVNNTQYAWVNNFDNEQEAKEFRNRWSDSSIFGGTIQCFASVSKESEGTENNPKAPVETKFSRSAYTPARCSIATNEYEEIPQITQLRNALDMIKSSTQQYDTSNVSPETTKMSEDITMRTPILAARRVTDSNFIQSSGTRMATQSKELPTYESRSTFPKHMSEIEEWHVKIIGLPEHISKRDLAARLNLPENHIVIPVDQQDHSNWFAWVNRFSDQQRAKDFAKQWEGACMHPNSEIRLRCQVRPPKAMNDKTLQKEVFQSPAVFSVSPDPDPVREKILQEQVESKNYYDSFPNIDDATNETTPAIKKAEELTKSILNTKPSGIPSNRDTLCHVLNKLLSTQDQQCLFYDSKNGTDLHDAAGNLADLGAEDKPFVLKLASSQGLGGNNNSQTNEDDLILVQTLKTSIKNEKSHPVLADIRNRLARAHQVHINNIIVKDFYVGTFNIVYTVSDLPSNLAQKLKNDSQNLKNQFPQFVSAKIHPLLYRPTFDISYFDERGNKTFGNQAETHQVGPPGRTQTYTTAAGWTRYGLRVLGKYDNDDWLHPFGHGGNWYRAFHGTGSARSEDFNGFNTFNEIPAPCVDALASIYKTGFRTARVAAYGPGVYCSPSPSWLEKTGFVGTVKLDTLKGTKNFQCMFQVAVNPNDVKCATNEIWVVPEPKNIRPYGILIKEV
ncbi:hypothetical protein I4U23_031465 [Adineta vaga]|nr:hypothetical protein I4U23_031465 [Adineta vaga]